MVDIVEVLRSQRGTKQSYTRRISNIFNMFIATGYLRMGLL